MSQLLLEVATARLLLWIALTVLAVHSRDSREDKVVDRDCHGTPGFLIPVAVRISAEQFDFFSLYAEWASLDLNCIGCIFLLQRLHLDRSDRDEDGTCDAQLRQRVFLDELLGILTAFTSIAR